MGYIGQHLTSVVTGFPGGRSGARGNDLVLPDGKHAEIKTCYRVDQLGACRTCRAAVASIESACANCGGTSIDRKDDSKWLITTKNEQELRDLFEAQWFFLVLFDFADLADPQQINARIWRVDPMSPGFALCMVDYFFNIRARSASAAPFNLWPFSPKFSLLDGELIYFARINDDDSIDTFIFPNEVGNPEEIVLDPLHRLVRSRALTTQSLLHTAEDLGVVLPGGDRVEVIAALQDARDVGALDERVLADTLAYWIYAPLVAGHLDHLPQPVRTSAEATIARLSPT